MLDKSTSWGKVADWYDELLEGDNDTYQEQVISPNLVRMLNIQRGETVLDLACGQGYFSRKFRDLGAKVIGVDVARELIDYACKNSPIDISYTVSPAHDLSFLNSSSIDAIVITLAAQNIENLGEVFTECTRVLKPEGRLIMILNHPAFRIPKSSEWEYSEEKNVEYRKMSGYMSDQKIQIDMHPGAQRKLRTITFHHPLQSFFKIFYKNNLCVTRLEEWVSHRESTSGPRADAENKAKKEIPMFMALEIKKCK
jgi:ubiquinone/menaquinone biosynthesis C-methylase UbiE